MARLSMLSLDDETIAATNDGEFDDEEFAEVPERVDRYLVLEELGAGAMGVVYAAYDPDLDRKLALKLLRHTEDQPSHRTIRLLREAQALARVSHPNVIQVYDVGTFEDRVYIAMEFIDGVALGDWLEAEPRDLRTIIEAFTAAGRGLAAAHHKGLVHRDFKPDNVLVAGDGRVVVLDFGIAHAVRKAELHEDPSGLVRSRIAEHSAVHSLTGKEALADWIAREGSEERSAEELSESGLSASGLDIALTRAGALVGTPAYMSPEQLEGRGADERSDQFSFCVALWEALHGQRPFVGDSPLSLWQAMRDGKIRAPARARVPQAIQRALTRGLSLEPGARFPDMSELLDVLERDPAAIRRRVAGAVVAVAAIGFGVWGLVRAPTPEGPVCAGAEQRLVGTWDGQRRAAVEQAFGASGLPLASLTLPGVLDGLERYAAEWTAMYRDACEATHVRNEQSEALLDLRMACLDERRVGLDALVEILLEPDATVIENSYAAVSRLRPIASCANRSALEARVAPPEDPALATLVDELARELSRARARLDAGDHERALDIARAAEARAAKTDYAPIQAGALIEVGRAQIETGDYDDAESTLERGFYEALTARDEDAALAASMALVLVSGDRQQDFETAEHWIAIADAILARDAHTRERERIELEYLSGVVHWREGELDRSRAELEHALELAAALTAEQGTESGRLLEIRVRKGLGSTLWGLGKAEEAAEQFQAVVDALSRELGPGHPKVGSALNNLASAHYSLGRHELAEAEFVRTLGIYESSYGDEHPSVANSLNNLAVVYTKAGKLQQARETHLRVLGIHERTLGPEHPELANSWSNLGRVLRRLHEYDEAVSYYRRAYERRREALGPEHADTMTSLGGLGVSLIALGERDEGVAKLRIVLDTQTRVLGAEHPTVAEIEQDFGAALVGIGEHDHLEQGEALLRRSLATREQVLPADHPDIAETVASLAHALVEQRAYMEAQALFERFLAMEEASKPGALVRAGLRRDLARVELERREFAAARATVAAGRALLEDVEGPDAKELGRELERLLESIPSE